MESLSQIKNWFKTGLKPTQSQFWSTWESYWHKEEVIPQSAIDALEETLDAKADAQALGNHLNDAAAHPQVMAAIKEQIPVSAAFSGDNISLQFKGPDARVLFTTTIAVENIEGLQAELDIYRYREVKPITAATYTATIEDARNKLQFNSLDSQVFYIDADFPNCVFECVQYGKGEVMVQAADGSGVTILTAPTEAAKTSEQYSAFAVEWQSEKTYLVYGKLALI
jgi:hypothetical protein